MSKYRDGWIAIHRQILDNPVVCKTPERLAVWIYLLLTAAFKDYDVISGGRRATIHRGQLITCRRDIADRFGMTQSKVERILQEFETAGQITQEGNQNGRLITINNYDFYQSGLKPADSKSDSKSDSRSGRRKPLNATDSENGFYTIGQQIGQQIGQRADSNSDSNSDSKTDSKSDNGSDIRTPVTARDTKIESRTIGQQFGQQNGQQNGQQIGHNITILHNNKEHENNINSPAKRDSMSEDVKTIIDFLNEKAGTHYRATSEKTKRLIRARMNEGFTVDDFKRVIAVKCAEWRGGDMEKYLRPETLFGTKFENYLNQPAPSEIGKRESVAELRAEVERWETIIAMGFRANLPQGVTAEDKLREAREKLRRAQ